MESRGIFRTGKIPRKAVDKDRAFLGINIPPTVDLRWQNPAVKHPFLCHTALPTSLKKTAHGIAWGPCGRSSFDPKRATTALRFQMPTEVGESKDYECRLIIAYLGAKPGLTATARGLSISDELPSRGIVVWDSSSWRSMLHIHPPLPDAVVRILLAESLANLGLYATTFLSLCMQHVCVPVRRVIPRSRCVLPVQFLLCTRYCSK